MPLTVSNHELVNKLLKLIYVCVQFLFVNPNQLTGQSNVDVRHTVLKGMFVLYDQYIMI